MPGPSIIDVANATWQHSPKGAGGATKAAAPVTLLGQQLSPSQQTPATVGIASRRDIATTISASSSSSTTATAVSTTNMNMSLDERMDAARTILGISPDSVIDTNLIQASSASAAFGGRTRVVSRATATASVATIGEGAKRLTQDSLNPNHGVMSNGQRSLGDNNSSGLDALAFLATQEPEAPVKGDEECITLPKTTTQPLLQPPMPVKSSEAMEVLSSSSSLLLHTGNGTNGSRLSIPPAQEILLFHKPAVVVASAAVSSCSSSDNDEREMDAMPPPAPRLTTTIRAGRRRSMSAPEGMERYIPSGYGSGYSSGFRLVLPPSILENEMAEAREAVKAKEEAIGRTTTSENSAGDHTLYGGESLHAGFASWQEQQATEQRQQRKQKHRGLLDPDDDDEDVFQEEQEEEEEEEEEEEILDQAELLRRARSRLLEDLSEVTLNGQKGVDTLPHTLTKYKEVYNKNGRIGIYTPSERAAIIAKFHEKRSRRVWNKKIRYNCRKNLADRRLRIKGRFVKRTPDTSTITSIPETDETAEEADSEMPDVSGPDSVFCPTADQPYRRLRRYTIT